MEAALDAISSGFKKYKMIWTILKVACL